MARKTLRPRTRAAAAPAPTLDARSLALASLGAVLRGRREVIRLAGEAAAVPIRLRAGAAAAAATARQEAAKLAKEAGRRIAPVKKNVALLRSQADQALAGAATTLNPLLARVGLPGLPGRPVAKKAAVRKTARRAAAGQRTAARAAAPRKRA